MSDDVSFRLAYDEAVRALRAQAEMFGGIRQRASTVLATTLVVTAFFGGQAVARGAAPSAAGWLAVVAFGVAGVLSVSVLFPSDPSYSAEIGAIVALVEDATGGHEPYRDLALTLSRQHGENSRLIRRLQWIFRLGAVALLVEAFFWILFLAET